MRSFAITDKKVFMNKLLKSDLFDTFEVREVVLHTAYKMVLDGKRNPDYYDILDETFTTYLNWKELKKNVYDLMQGNRPPSYFKIIFSTTPEKTIALSPQMSTFFLNIHFKDNMVTCSTGAAYKQFSLDQSGEHLWDERMEKFLLKYEFI